MNATCSIKYVHDTAHWLIFAINNVYRFYKNGCILTCPHISVMDTSADKAREMDRLGNSGVVYSRIIADLFQ